MQGQKYKLEKKIKKADLDEESEIISSYRANQNIILPIEEFGMLNY